MTLRITLALLVIVPAAMSYPWQSTIQRWVLGVAIAVVLIVFAWWRGLFITTMVARRVAIWRRNHGTSTPPSPNRVTVVLRVDATDESPTPSSTTLPLSTIAGYVDRFGIRCDTVRVTSCDAAGLRRTWVGVTIAADANLAALQARSASVPLFDAAEVVGRRLADHLREMGLDAAIVETADAPLSPRAREGWRAVTDDQGSLVAHAISVDGRLAERLAAVWARTSQETWTSLEFSGTAAHPTVSAVAAIRADSVVGVEGVVAIAGRQRPVLAALDPRSLERLGVAAAPRPDDLDDVGWTVASTESVYQIITRT